MAETVGGTGGGGAAGGRGYTGESGAYRGSFFGGGGGGAGGGAGGAGGVGFIGLDGQGIPPSGSGGSGGINGGIASTADNVTISTALSGGNGGNGGTGYNGGGGGAGGFGYVITAPSIVFTIAGSGSVGGGTGGDAGVTTGVVRQGGLAFYASGGGGGGGILVVSDGVTINNAGVIRGGNGGAGGGISGDPGAGGDGIRGANLIVVNSGSIEGGTGGTNQSNGSGAAGDAVVFTSGTNTFEYQGGTVTGNVIGGGTNDTFLLGGSVDRTFNVSVIGGQYQNFENLGSTGTGTWTLTGTSSTTLTWTVSSGTINLSNASLVSADFTVGNAASLIGSGTVNTLTIQSGGILGPGNSPGLIVATDGFKVETGGTLKIEIGGTTAGTGYDQIDVTGTVELAGTLDLSLINPFVPSLGNSFTLINNDGNDSVTGQFVGYDEGSIFTLGGQYFTITYKGGHGQNDVVLSYAPPTPYETVNLGAAVDEGSSVGIANTALKYADTEQPAAELTYKISSETNGTVLLDKVALGTGDTFTQADIDSGLVTFAHDGSETTTAGFDFTVSDGTGNTSDSNTFTITVTPVNDVATFSGNKTGTISEDATAKVQGVLTVSDADAGQSTFQTPAALDGLYGTFTFAFTGDTGTWTYTLDNSNGDVQALTSTASLVDKLVVMSRDGTEQEIAVTINGRNDAATFGGDKTKTITEDDMAKVGGTLTVNDVDKGEGTFQTPVSGAGIYGTFTFTAATGQWDYGLNNSSTLVQSLKDGQSVTDTLTVKSLDGTTQDITVTINGKNDAAVISGVNSGDVAEDGKTKASGTLTVSDVDTDEDKLAKPTSLAGTYGDFALNTATGKWEYALRNTDANVQALAAGQTVKDTLVVKSFDDTDSETITVTITGKNDAADISGKNSGKVAEDGTTKASGTLSVSDVDAGEDKLAMPTSLAGTYGDFTLSTKTGTWEYTLRNTDANVQALAGGQTVTDKLVVKSFDDTDSETITVTIAGKNDGATISGENEGAVSEDNKLVTSGKLTVLDADAGQSKFAAAGSLAGTYGAFTFDPTKGDWGYTLANASQKVQALKAGQTVKDMLKVTSLDGTVSETITVTITGMNDAPTGAPTAKLAAGTEDTKYTIKASDLLKGFSDIEGDVLSVTGLKTSSGTLVDNKNGTYTLAPVANSNGAVTLTYGVTDGTATLANQTLSFSLKAVDDVPTAVVLSNVSAPLPETTSTKNAIKVADIAVTDIDGGNNVLSLTGLDAAMFSIVGSGLYLNAGALLDFETNPSLDVTVNVKPSGGAISASKALTIAVLDRPEVVRGSSGTDNLVGNPWAETLDGAGGNDTITGGGGDDTIIGGLGRDILTGGEGRDTFVFGTSDSAPGVSGYINNGPLNELSGAGLRDIITDFTPGFDLIDLLGIDAQSAVAGDQAFAFKGTGNFAAAGDLIYRQFDNAGSANDKTIIYGDVNGDRAADFQIELTGLKTLSAADFRL